MLDRDDYDREGRNRYPDDDEDERFSTSYRERDRRYDSERDRERDHRDPRRYDDRDRAYNRQDYDDDRRSGYGPTDRDRARDPRRRDTRRFVPFFFLSLFSNNGFCTLVYVVGRKKNLRHTKCYKIISTSLPI